MPSVDYKADSSSHLITNYIKMQYSEPPIHSPINVKPVDIGMQYCTIQMQIQSLKQMQNSKAHMYASYFKGIADDIPASSCQISSQLAGKIVDKIHHQISEETLELPEELGKKPIKVSKRAKREAELGEGYLLKKIQNEKKGVLEKFRDLQREQNDLKMRIIADSQRKRSAFKSEMTEQDKAKLRDLINASRVFERSLNKKTKQIQKIEKQQILEMMKSEQLAKEQRRKTRAQQIQQKLKHLMMRSQQRDKDNQEALQKIDSLKHKKYLHMLKEENDAIQSMRQREEFERKIKENRDKMKFDIKEIEHHQKKYEEIMQEYRANSQSRISEKHHRSQSYGENYFRSMALSNIERERMEEYNRLNRGHQFKEKICKYSAEVQKKHQPKVSKESRFILPKSKSLSTHGMTSAMQRVQGLEYLQKAKKMKDLDKQMLRKKSLEAKASPEHRYTDYSKQIKVKQFQKTEKQFYSMVRGKPVADYDEVSKAVLLADKIDSKSKKSKDQALVSSVKNKLKILEALEG